MVVFDVLADCTRMLVACHAVSNVIFTAAIAAITAGQQEFGQSPACCHSAEVCGQNIGGRRAIAP